MLTFVRYEERPSALCGPWGICIRSTQRMATHVDRFVRGDCSDLCEMQAGVVESNPPSQSTESSIQPNVSRMARGLLCKAYGLLRVRGGCGRYLNKVEQRKVLWIVPKGVKDRLSHLNQPEGGNDLGRHADRR